MCVILSMFRCCHGVFDVCDIIHVQVHASIASLTIPSTMVPLNCTKSCVSCVCAGKNIFTVWKHADVNVQWVETCSTASVASEREDGQGCQPFTKSLVFNLIFLALYRPIIIYNKIYYFIITNIIIIK